MQRRRYGSCATLTLAFLLAACSDALTAPVPRDLGPFDSYAAAPCAAAIDHDIASWHETTGDPLSVTVRTGGDTTVVRVSFEAPAGYEQWYDGTVWQEYYWLPSWDYCMAWRTGGLVEP